MVKNILTKRTNKKTSVDSYWQIREDAKVNKKIQKKEVMQDIENRYRYKK